MRRPLSLLALLALAGCTDGWLTVSIRPDDPANTPIETLTVRAMAANAEDTPTAFCRPTVRTFTSSGTAFAWPLELVFVAGSERWSCLALQVEGLATGHEPYFAERLICGIDWSREATYNFYLLSAFASGASSCENGDVLVNNECQAPLEESGFFTPDAEQASEPCDAD